MIFGKSALMVMWLGVMAGCAHPIYSWDQGYPDVGASSAPEGIQRFKIGHIGHQVIKVGERNYSRITFEPIFRHFCPEVVPILAEADSISANDALISGAMVGLLTYAAPDAFSKQIDKLRDVIVFGMIAAGSYLSAQAQPRYDEAREIFNAKLVERLGKAGRVTP